MVAASAVAASLTAHTASDVEAALAVGHLAGTVAAFAAAASPAAHTGTVVEAGGTSIASAVAAEHMPPTPRTVAARTLVAGVVAGIVAWRWRRMVERQVPDRWLVTLRLLEIALVVRLVVFPRAIQPSSVAVEKRLRMQGRLLGRTCLAS